MSNVPWSSFSNVGSPNVGDQLVGLRTVNGSLTNVRYNFNTNPDHLVEREISQTAHGFSAGQVVRFNGTIYVLAQADSAAHCAGTVGMVGSSIDANDFVLVMYGYLNTLSGLSAGSLYWISASVAGAITATEPSTPGQVSKMVFIADSTTSGYFANQIGQQL